MTIATKVLTYEPGPYPHPALPSPAKVFADWLLWLPHGIDIRAAAREQIASIDRRASHHPDVQFLRMLLVALAEGDKLPVRRRKC